ncbi:peptidoglycan editing factor PgeF [Solilutibacter silvestris]|uniref:Purine nucleoside phosphorylase n=1 Tax=Solilutibacter silvestris TaxID=1645665 RepID=A0A2K1Q2Q6_9GAMM|nr:peptidoglycan editing factor PgeF [Lysobacter silvestris]PNS09325.1 putative YfiH family protein [Lysobacter silvestris]
MSRAWIVADWPAPPRVRVVTTTRHGLGVSQAPFDHLNLGLRNGDTVDAALENRRLLEAALELPSSPRWLRQVHGTAVVRFEKEGSHSDEPEADASMTSTPGVVLAILTADCLPVVVAARDGSEIAAAHAGWKGLSGGVLEATIAAMQTSPHDCIAWLGPAAGPQAYEIGEDVRDAFLAHDRRAESAFVPTRPGHWLIDLYAIARQRLADAGVREVHGGTHCTITESRTFFSHRRDQRTGRMATLAWIES